MFLHILYLVYLRMNISPGVIYSISFKSAKNTSLTKKQSKYTLSLLIKTVYLQYYTDGRYIKKICIDNIESVESGIGK